MWCAGRRGGDVEEALRLRILEDLEDGVASRDTVKVTALLQQLTHIGVSGIDMASYNATMDTWRAERRRAMLTLIQYARPRLEVVVLISILNAVRPFLWDRTKLEENSLNDSAREADLPSFVHRGGRYLTLALCDTGVSFIISMLKRQEVEFFSANVKKHILEHLLRLDQEYYDRNKTELGEFQDDVLKLRYLVTDRLFQIIRFGFVSAHAFRNALAGKGQALITISCFLCIPVLAAVRSGLNWLELWVDGKTKVKLPRKTVGLKAKPTATVSNLVSRLTVVRAASAEDQELCRILAEEDAVLTDSIISQTIGERLLEALRGTIIPNMLFLTLTTVGKSAAMVNLLSQGAVVSTVETAIEAFENSNALYEEIYDLSEADYIVRLMSVLNAKPTIDVTDTKIVPLSFKKCDLSVQNVTFTYPTNATQVVLNQLSFTLPLGSRLAIVGRSGSGKSSLAMLLIRLYDPVEGGIYLSGVNIKTLNVRLVRQKVVTVPQGVKLHQETVLEALLYGIPEGVATRKDIERVCKLLGIHDLITSFKQGYNTKLSTGGVQLSGGQAQRVAIARALLSKPTVLILDEATSGLDIPTERLVISAVLSELGPATSLILISHRPSTVSYCDTVMCIAQGTIIEHGETSRIISDTSTYTSKLFAEQGALEEVI
eukprot:TRINITY_DN9015_c0_g1_i1.p1 TRINITY_DN9015_c0_g1~~TRINITY_DN9015_c0_g1_i1.p1  ORF type:complete len:724 (+),score=125.18 TRINITY_DN9015_c0_g1_i1:196-2172(+)